MPIYSFSCGNCGHKFEELLTVKEREKAICPKCSGVVSRSYDGPCAFGRKSTGSAGGKSCNGSCAGCAGCGAH